MKPVVKPEEPLPLTRLTIKINKKTTLEDMNKVILPYISKRAQKQVEKGQEIYRENFEKLIEKQERIAELKKQGKEIVEEEEPIPIGLQIDEKYETN